MSRAEHRRPGATAPPRPRFPVDRRRLRHAPADLERDMDMPRHVVAAWGYGALLRGPSGLWLRVLIPGPGDAASPPEHPEFAPGVPPVHAAVDLYLGGRDPRRASPLRYVHRLHTPPPPPGLTALAHSVLPTSASHGAAQKLLADLPRTLRNAPRTIACVETAAWRYQVPTRIVLAVMRVENGAPQASHANTNGTDDYGPMQINSIWGRALAKRGPASAEAVRRALQKHPCYNIAVGTWLLASHLDGVRPGDPRFWTRLARYHSRTAKHAKTWQSTVKGVLRRWARGGRSLASKEQSDG